MANVKINHAPIKINVELTEKELNNLSKLLHAGVASGSLRYMGLKDLSDQLLNVRTNSSDIDFETIASCKSFK